MIVFKKTGWVLRSILKKFDLFSTNQFIKFNKESQYTTATGGFISLVLIILIIIMFSNKGLQILNRTLISSSISTQIDTDPSPLTLVTSTQGGFMFAIGVYPLNLNDPSITYFSISLSQNYYSPIFKLIKTTQVPLVQCSVEHFAFNQKMLQEYEKINLSYFLCPPIGYEFNVGGRLTSQIFSQFTLNVYKCNSSISTNCASDATMQKILAQSGSFTLAVPFVNTIVNPNDQEYLQTFLEDRNYFTFTPSYGVSVNAQISEYEIDTDVSIMPITKMVTEFITTIPNLFNSKSTTVTDNLYATVYFSKSGTVVTYARNFVKIDEFISYIGGLIGSALVVFSVLISYSEHSFYIDLASKLLLAESPEFSLRSFNIVVYLGVMVKKVLGFIPWSKGELFIKSIQEMKQQLDISLLMKKILFLQEAVSSILSDHQLDTLYLRDKRSFSVMANWRQKHKIAQLMRLDLQQPQIYEKTDMPLKNDEEISESSMHCHKDTAREQILLQQMRANVQKVVNESKNNDLISQRILNKFGPETFQRISLKQGPNKPSIELMQFQGQNVLQTRFPRKSKNAVRNEYNPKQQRKIKELEIDNIQD